MLHPYDAAPLAAVGWFRAGQLYHIYSFPFLGIQVGIAKDVLHLSWAECSCYMDNQDDSAAVCFITKTTEIKKAALQRENN